MVVYDKSPENYGMSVGEDVVELLDHVGYGPPTWSRSSSLPGEGTLWGVAEDNEGRWRAVFLFSSPGNRSMILGAASVIAYSAEHAIHQLQVDHVARNVESGEEFVHECGGSSDSWSRWLNEHTWRQKSLAAYWSARN